MTAFILSWAGSADAQEIPDRWRLPMNGARPLFKADTLTVRVLGDMMMHEKQILNSRSDDGSYDFSTYFTFIGDEIREADIAVANMEFTLAGEPYTGYPCFSAPDDYARYLADCGFDIFLAANNHIFDKGTEGAERTLEFYRSLHETHGIAFTGLAADEEEMNGTTPLVIRRKGIRLAILNFTYGTNTGLGTAWPRTNYAGERTRLEQALAKAGSEADFTLVFPHWGTEYILHHSESQERTAAWLIGNGADMIIGAHPHVIQDCGEKDGVQIAYSLGNAVSNMSAANTQMELMATIRIVRGPYGDMKILPLEFQYLWCSRPGGFGDSYTVIPVSRFIGRESEWKNRADYQKMMATYERIRQETHINE